MSTRSLILALLTILGALSSRADVIERTYVGTLSNPLTSFADQPGGGPDPGTNPGLISRGGKYLVRVSYDTNDLILVPAAARNFSSLDMQVVQLTDDPAAPNATNTYELFLPSEGFGQILTQIQRAERLTAEEAFSHRIDNLSVTEIHHVPGDGTDGWRAGKINHLP